VGQSEGGAGIAFRALQLLQDSWFTADHASNGCGDCRSRMGVVRIDRTLVLTVLLAGLALEVLAFKSLETVPLDIGYPPGTSEWAIFLGWPGLIIHYPALMLEDWLGSIYPLFPWMLVLCMLGYLDSLIVVAAVVFLYRNARRVISSQ